MIRNKRKSHLDNAIRSQGSTDRKRRRDMQIVGFTINLPSVSPGGMKRRTRRSEERVDKKAIVSVRVSEVAWPEGPPRCRSQCKRGRLHRRCGADAGAGAGCQHRHPGHRHQWQRQRQLGNPAAIRELVYECSPRLHLCQ